MDYATQRTVGALRVSGVGRIFGVVVLLLISLLAASSKETSAQNAKPALFGVRTKPFQICSISFPLIGSNYLDDQPACATCPQWASIPTIISQIKALGANDVKVTISAGAYDTPTDNLPNLSVSSYSPSDNRIIAFIQQLKAAGFQVTVTPFVHIAFDPNGNLLDTVHAQPTDFNAWMTAHASIMVHLAQVAQQAAADRFVVFGDEVQPLTYNSANQAGWLDMIARIRAVYSGSLTSTLSSAGTISNGVSDIERTPRPILTALDLIGVGWFPQPLTITTTPTLAQLLASWRGTAKGVDSVAFLQNLHTKYGKPVWVSDIAFHSFTGDNINSSDIFNVQIPLKVDEQEQANEYDSFITVMSQNAGDWLLGVSFDSWNRFPPGYNVARFLYSPYGENIQGKLAEAVLAPWYNGQRGWAGMSTAVTATGTNADLVLTGHVTVSPIDSGRVGNLFVAAVSPARKMYWLSPRGGWVEYQGGLLTAYGTARLGSHDIPIFDGSVDVTALHGTKIMVGYGIDQDDMLRNKKYSVVYTVP